MNRITQLDPATATGKTKQLFDAVQAKLGVVPNLVRVLGNSPAALEAYVNFSGALAGGTLGAKVREQISLAVAEGNLCSYCLSAHSFIGGKVGLSEKDIADARHTNAASAKTDAVLKLALSVLVQRGEISDGALKAARAAGLTDGEIVETVANVAVNIFTNYVNHVAQTVVDFPEVKPGDATESVASH
ncbi:MAG TPA: carboxymuconolactone decarboxylase family protein [Candidatus Limnocylindria bacterium]|nr:carboxymuconolactone decarboxylase family protein [Candidatus Limnocylindria bacterium]